MAGRAGRRGLDEFGTVIITAWSGLPNIHSLRQTVAGVPLRLESKFHLTFGMILNLMRVEDMNVMTAFDFLSCTFTMSSYIHEIK